MQIKDTKRGDLIKLIVGGSVKPTVYVRGSYDRSSKSYEISRWDDISSFRYVKGNTACTTDFEF